MPEQGKPALSRDGRAGLAEGMSCLQQQLLQLPHSNSHLAGSSVNYCSTWRSTACCCTRKTWTCSSQAFKAWAPIQEEDAALFQLALRVIALERAPGVYVALACTTLCCQAYDHTTKQSSKHRVVKSLVASPLHVTCFGGAINERKLSRQRIALRGGVVAICIWSVQSPRQHAGTPAVACCSDLASFAGGSSFCSISSSPFCSSALRLTPLLGSSSTSAVSSIFCCFITRRFALNAL